MPGCSGELPRIADAIGFPDHEIVQRLPRLVRDESDNDRVIDEAEKRSLVRNQIEWVDQIVESSYDPREIIIRNLFVFARARRRGPAAASSEDTANSP